MKSSLTNLILALGPIALVACTEPHAAAAPPQITEVAVSVTASGYEPSEVIATAGQPVRLLVTRTTDEGCGQVLAIPDLGIERPLPLGEQVAIDVPARAAGRLRFTCGMGMYEGAVVVR